jgi:uncharacterized protein (DUF433 family)
MFDCIKSVQRDVDVLGGALVFTRTRVMVQTLFDYLERLSLNEFLEDFPMVTREQTVDLILERYPKIN